MMYILRLLMGLCPEHNYGWPQRREDGQDWQTCTRCGDSRVSVIQFIRTTESTVSR